MMLFILPFFEHPQKVVAFESGIENVRITVMWATDYGDVGQSRSGATLVVFLH